MWSSLSQLFCGSFGRLLTGRPLNEPLEDSPSPDKKTEENPKDDECNVKPSEQGDFESVSTADDADFSQKTSLAQKLAEDIEANQQNPAETERLKLEFLHQSRSKYAAPPTEEELAAYKKQRRVLKLKAKYLAIRPDSKFAEESEKQKPCEEGGFIASLFRG